MTNHFNPRVQNNKITLSRALLLLLLVLLLALLVSSNNSMLSRKGFATDGEVKRQLDALLGSLEREATHPWNESAEVAEEQSVSPWRADDPTGLSYRLMQYNPPYTLPWLRTNAVAVKVVKGEAEAALGAGAVDIPVSVLVDDGGGGR